jgi:hypothetical protein
VAMIVGMAVVVSMGLRMGGRAIDGGTVIMRVVVHGNILRGLHRACSGVNRGCYWAV